VLLTGEWEPEETAVMRELLAPGAVVYDIGANVGYFTLLAAQMVGASGHVYAFEPNPAVLPQLRNNIAINALDNVTVLPVALSDTEGRATFYAVGGANSGTSSLRAEVGENIEVEVEVVRMDTLVQAQGLRPPDVVKMDIEGAECLALAGMGRTLGTNEDVSLLIEVSDRFLRHIGSSEDELLELVDLAGFELVRQVSRHLRTEPDGRPFQYTALFRRGPTKGLSD